jgi:fido (protein-threonine AMPylation protein)
MKTAVHQDIAGASQLKKLRNALAIIHCRRLLSTFQKEAEGTISHDQAKRVTYLTELFSRIHREIFQDWKDQAINSDRPGAMADAEKRKLFREAIESLVLYEDENKDTALFDNNGFVIKTGNIAERLARFYSLMRKIKPFGYGNKMTLDFFMTALSSLPAFGSVYEQGIDFRRLDANDTMIMHDYNSSLDEVTDAFRHALDPTRTRCLDNSANGYGKWPEQKTFVFGMPFLRHQTAEGIDCLVTVNGGLVPLNSLREEDIPLGTHFADYPLSLSKSIIGYLPGTESLRGKADIDGIKIGPHGEAPLFCLDLNILTGLRSPSHTEFTELLKECAGEKTPLFSLANNPELKARLLEAAEGDERLSRAVEIAYQRLSRIARKLDRSKQAIFEGKTPSDRPKLFLCMGGAGAGKTAVEEIARAQCGDNFVTASLDEFRKQSDLYLVLTAANHHSDDYIYVEPFANTLRDWVASQARVSAVNLLYDGTSIPYVPRYSGIVEAFKTAGFVTLIAAVDAFIVKPRGREEELPRAAAIGSVKDRFQKTGRALPWVVAVDKHIRAPGAFLDALEHPELDKLSLFANDGEMDRHYLVAESFSFTAEEIRQMQEHQRAGSLADFLKVQIMSREGSTLRNIAGHNPDNMAALIERIPAWSEANVAYQIYNYKDGHRVLAVYSARRMVDFLEKGQLNPNASGEDGLLHKHASLAFHIDPRTPEPWTIRLQDSSSEKSPEDRLQRFYRASL